MAGDLIITASAIITMNKAAPRATAVAVDTGSGTITAVGSLAQCRAAAPDAEERDLGDTVLMPGFIEAHSHPFLSGVVTQSPAYWIAPYVGYPGWDDVAALFHQVNAEQPAGTTLVFSGLDRMLQQVAEPDNTVLDGFSRTGRSPSSTTPATRSISTARRSGSWVGRTGRRRRTRRVPASAAMLTAPPTAGPTRPRR